MYGVKLSMEIQKQTSEHLYNLPKFLLPRCCVTTTFTNVEDLELTEDSDEMKQINEIVKEINEISSKFEVAQNSGTYNDMKS